MQKIITGSTVKVGRDTWQKMSLAVDCLTVVFNEFHRWSEEDLIQTNYSAGVCAS